MVHFYLDRDHWNENSGKFFIRGMGVELEYYDTLCNEDIAYFLKIEDELFRTTMTTQFNAIKDSKIDIFYFNDVADGEKAIEWIRSIQTIEKLIE